MGLCGVGGLEHGDAGKGRVVAAVLLVLRGVDGGVVCGENDQTAVDAGVADAHQRVCRDVDADVLHGHERARAAHGSADADLEGDLLVGGPLAVDVLVLGEVFQCLCRRSAGVTDTNGNATLPGSLGDGLVAGKKLLTHVNLSL